MKIIHLEDSFLEREDMKKSISQYSNMELICSTGIMEVALRMLKTNIPEVVILDLELHEGSGSGLSFLYKMQDMCLPIHPFVLVTTCIYSSHVHEILRDYGADFIMVKEQEDYSSDFVVNFIDLISKGGRRITKDTIYKEKKYIQRVDEELNKVNIKLKAKGRRFLKEAIIMKIEGEENYRQELALKYNTTVKNLDNDMRNAIKSAWLNAPIDDLLANYEAGVNPATGIPTVDEFVWYYATKLKKGK